MAQLMVDYIVANVYGFLRSIMSFSKWIEQEQKERHKKNKIKKILRKKTFWDRLTLN